MNQERTDILASFCARDHGKYPDRQSDFLQRSLRIEALARWHAKAGALTNDDLDAAEQFDMGQHQDRLEAEAERMVVDGYLFKPKLSDLDHWQPPQGVYQLTPKGATAAAAVLKAFLAQQKEALDDR